MINIAIDGYAGSGKSVLANGLAQRLGYKVLDTGALYRGLACAFREGNFGELNEKNVVKFLKDVDVKIEFHGKVQHVLVNGVDYTSQLRENEISNMASKISTFPKLRDKILYLQRDFAKENNCVMEGRDIATNVLPNAQIKIFLTADVEKRAKRRYDEMQNKQNVTFEQVLLDLKERDKRDETREVAPLKPAKDSVILDNGDLTIEGTVERALEIVNEKLNGKN